MKSNNIAKQTTNQAKLNANLEQDKLKEYIYKIIDDKIVRIPNPSFDSELFKKFNEESLNKNKKDKINLDKRELQRMLEGKATFIYNNKEESYSMIKTSKQYQEEIKEVMQIYKRLIYFKNPEARIQAARRFHIQNKQGFKPSLVARQLCWKRQREKAKTTPAIAETAISKERLKTVIEQIRCRKGKNKHALNSTHIILNFLVYMAIKGEGWLYISHTKIGKKNNFCKRTVLRAINLLEKEGILIKHKSHLCPNIYQINLHLLTTPFLRLLTAFSNYQFYVPEHVITQKLKKYDYIYNNYNLNTLNITQKEDVKPLNNEIRQILFKTLKISTPVLCP